MDKELIINELRYAMEAQGLTYRQLADRMGSPVSKVYTVMKGGNPTLDTLLSMCNALGITISLNKN